MRRLLLVVILALAARPAAADDAATARQRADEADALAKAGDFVGAASAYKAAHALDPRAEYQCNVGVAYWKARDLPRAQLFLNVCLSRGSHLPATFLESVRLVLATVEDRLREGEFAPVDVVVRPDAAEVRVAGWAADDVFVGSRIVWLPFGEHALEVRAPGHVAATRTVTVAARDHVEVRIDLEPAPVAPPPAIVTPPATREIVVVTPPPSRTPALIGSGITVVALVADVLLYRRARDSAARAGALPPGPDYDNTADVAEARRNQLYAMYGVTAAAAGVSAWLWWRARPRGPQVSVGATGEGAAVSLSGRF